MKFESVFIAFKTNSYKLSNDHNKNNVLYKKIKLLSSKKPSFLRNRRNQTFSCLIIKEKKVNKQHKEDH